MASSGSEGQLIALMRLTPGQFQAAWRRGRTVQWLGALVAWLLLVGSLVFFQADPFALGLPPLPAPEISLVTDAVTAIALILVPAAALICIWLFVPSQKQWLGSRTLRSVMLAGESKQAPAAFDRPPPLAADELPRDAEQFNRLKVVDNGNNFFGIALFFMMVMLLALVAVVVSGLQLWRLDSQLGQLGIGIPGPSSLDALQGCQVLLQALLVIFTVGRVMGVAGGFQMIPAGWGAVLPAPRPKLLAVDDWGIRWRRRGWRRREVTLPWHDVRAFCVIWIKPSANAYNAYTYLLTGDDLSFAWTLPARAKAPTREMSALLSRLVVTRTQLPLLDITQAINSIDQWTSAPMNAAGRRLRGRFVAKVTDEANKRDISSEHKQELRERMRSLVGDARMADEIAPLYRATFDEIERSGSPTRRLRMRSRFYWLNIVLLLLVAAGICGLWSLNDYRLAAYYQALPSRINAETPVFSDPLTSQDYAWDIQTPTATDSTSAQYAYGGYAMTGGPTGNTNEETLDAQYTDVAIAVTARQMGSSKNDGVGLIARSLANGASESDEIIFYVSPSYGGWSLYHYQPGHSNSDDNWNYIDGGDSPAIHKGENASNRLLLVLRGTEYLCYINGQFVARDVDSTVTPSSPKFGYPGLFVDDNTTTGVFNDFAVYNLPSPYQPLLQVFHG